MTWKTALEINRAMFALPKGRPLLTFWKAAAWVLSVAGILGSYFKMSDILAHWAIRQTSANVDSSLKLWDASPHTLSNLAAAAGVLMLVYLGAFAYLAQDRLDYRSRLAESLGIRFLSVRREHDVLDLSGRCHMTTTDEFEVLDLQLSYIERKVEAPTANNRTIPEIHLEGLPEGTTYQQDQRDEGSLRSYIVNFTPPLRRTKKAVRLRLSEESDNVILMYEQDTPIHRVFNAKVEAVSQFVVEPIDRLELAVTFPRDYRVGGESQLSVRYRDTRSRHDGEEHRLVQAGAIAADENNGRQTLRLVVEEPIIGLHYYLHWIPPKKKEKA